jgi:hypothetical protein
MPLLIIITICIQEINTACLVSAKQKNRLWDYLLALIRKAKNKANTYINYSKEAKITS